MATNPANDILIRAVMTASTGLPQDQVVNDFAFHHDDGITDAEIDAHFDDVDRFYRALLPNGRMVGGFISNFVNRAATHSLKAYRISSTGATDSPVKIMDWLGPPTAAAAEGLPTECAAVLSFYADLTGVQEEVGASRPRARRRGRLFIGPLNLGAMTLTVPPYRLDGTFTQSLRQAASRLITESEGHWSVWSRKDGTLRPVVGGWTDDAPDTQRRRGVQASARVVYT